ncbi:hypothetical protein [Nonomuraea africana]|uniref:hypothetical protein n=1 Tax=Nonomuraea africana TaxID=46171 RepID=UPI0033C2976A
MRGFPGPAWCCPGGAYPDRTTLQFFDAPHLVTGFRLHLVLLAVAALLWLLSATLTAGGQSRATNSYGGAEFLAFCGFGLALIGTLSAYRILAWIAALTERHRSFSFTVMLACAMSLP